MVNLSFRQALLQKKVLLMDGAMGTMLQASGLPVGVSPEEYCIANPDRLKSIHKLYLDSGADIVSTCTFGANPFKLPKNLDVFDFNRKMAEIARLAAESVDRDVFVAGDIGPSGQFIKPLGEIDPIEFIDTFTQQIKGLVAGGVDCILIETQFDLAEARAIVVACRKVTDLPILVSMTFEGGLSLTGSSPMIFAETMQNLGVDVLGTNCSLGPDQMLPVVEELLSVSNCPVFAQPNAGLPELRDNVTVFPVGPEEYAQKTAHFAALGVQILGGCCGTTPDHIKCLSNKLKEIDYIQPKKHEENGICLTSRSKIVRIGKDQPLVIIGERINPTGKKILAQELQANTFNTALQFADEQVLSGARVLDVNVGAPLVDETKVLPKLVELLVGRMTEPLSLDSPNIKAIESALPWAPGSYLVNSINGEGERMSVLGPLCRDYGSPFILLPIQGAELPVSAKERIVILEKLLLQAEKLNIPRRLVLVDILALSVSSFSLAAKECLALIEWCNANNLPTTLGLSNISFGLPARELLNATFLAMGVGAGLSSCIANPSAIRLRECFDAVNVLKASDENAENFIASYSNWKPLGGEIVKKDKLSTKANNLGDAVLLGDRENVLSLLEKDLKEGKDPFSLVQDILIPSITKVGDKYEKKEYFLPQLIRSAETMQLAFSKLKPLLEEKKVDKEKPVIVMATVEGDIHDIGKNIVSLLLGNHGFEVIDAGKDVSAKDIVDCAVKNKACIIGLSALMTTTMVRMEDTISLIKERNLPVKVMVGGAAVTQAFAESIGADAYCADAVCAVREAKKLL